MNKIRLTIWLARYTFEFKKRTGWTFTESLKYGLATMENFNFNLEDLDCPIDMVSEDIFNWSD